MSIEVVSWVLREAPTTSPVQQMVLVGIANHAEPDGSNAFPSVATLAGYARTSERTVQRTLRELLDLGVIEVQEENEKRDAYIRRPDRRPVGYRVLTTANTLTHPLVPSRTQRGDNLSPRSEARGDTGDVNGVTPEVERGDTHVTRTVREPSRETSTTTTPANADAGKVRNLKPHAYDHDPAVCCLVARWYDGWNMYHVEKPDPSVTKRVAGHAAAVAKDRKTYDDWVRAAEAAFNAGKQGIYDIVQGIPVQRTSQFVSEKIMEERAIFATSEVQRAAREARDAEILAARAANGR